MLFNLKPTLLFGLALTAVASPIASDTDPLEARDLLSLLPRAQVKDVNCGGAKFTAANINAAIKQSKVVETARAAGQKGYGKYPETYGNGEKFFKSTSQLYAYPLISGVYSGSGSSFSVRKKKKLVCERCMSELIMGTFLGGRVQCR